jgi:hypothetical protein
MSNKDHNSIAKLWTRIGWALLLAFLPFIFFIRGGANVLGEDIASEAMQITMAGWGVFGFSLGLCGLSILGLVHINRLSDEYSSTPWPADTNHEGKNRDILISKLFLIFYSAAPIISIIVGIVRYTDSHVSPWNSKSALSQGFIQSRISAYNIGCSKQPCFRIHPDNGHEYILYLTDGVLIISVVSCIILWSVWIYSIVNKSRKT